MITRLRPEIIQSFHRKVFSTPVIGVTDGKGGVGKTTVAVNIAASLADMGLRVALVDDDVDAPNAAFPKGKTDVKFNFIKTGNFKGKGELFVNGALLDEVDMPTMHIATFSLPEPFDVGENTGTPVSDEYDDHFYFNGDLKKVVITLTD